MSELELIAIIAGLLAGIAVTVVIARVVTHRHQVLRALQETSETISRLLNFSQTIQGAGRPEQIYPTLCHYLKTELNLSNLAILTHEPELIPPTTLVAAWPKSTAAQTGGIGEMETSLCPCLRQSLPWQFDPSSSPVRCAIEESLSLPSSQPAYCIPFNFGPGLRAVVHMVLPAGQVWTDARKQLAQAYVNTAQAALAALQLLIEAERQSMTDGLTGLFNRRSLDQLLLREVALAERHGHTLSVVMVDLDYFKAINDTHGHAAGDHMLKSFADCVRITLRKTDLAFRYGGDEFVVALPQTTLAQAQQVMQKLRDAFGTVDFSHAITHLQSQPTLSMGVAERSVATNVLTMSQILAAADQALYQAKAGTRNCIKVYEPPKAA